jgi:two-component system chemotaxis sensor kinase CheA
MLTDISGRGVGMDVVRTNISELNGQVLIDSTPGQGTQITLLLPLTLVTTRILLVNVNNQLFALPASGCRGIIWVYQERISTIEGRPMIEHNERTVPVMRLADVMGMESELVFENDQRVPAVMLGHEQRLFGLLVDDVLDEREAVVKPVGPLLELQRRYSGAVQLGDGQLVLMLNPMALSQAARGLTFTPTVAEAASSLHQQRRLLIADDSFTTRELIRSILHSAGYEVTAAIDGLDALDKLRAQAYDLVVSDVEMPRMNGFELTTSIRQELGLTDLPVIIITSLASDEHKRRGMEAGAQAYIVKSQFNQDNLLEAIQQLLGN